ncbi:TetR/AcrR family transcriptional regulator [Synechococcus sp. CCY 9618]|uniref:TetR/AcrR family transcriptional regulator n=1 Tax=Synechococcus sp. CCY 9618 TaxID=2815602 RepID=UPI001C23343C|nr:TetR/AcrR family transcriptional regulator [Synechococcus sp. CCY 9618]
MVSPSLPERPPSPPPAPITRRASPKRDALLGAARELFSRQGYRAVGIDTVLARAGVAKMTLYKHFGSKEELIAAVLTQVGEEISAALTARVAATSADGGPPLLAMFDWLEAAVRAPDFHGCLFIKAASEYPDPGDLPRQAAVAFKQNCRALLEQLCRGAGAANPEQLAGALHLLLEGALVLAFLQRDPQAAVDARRAAALLLEDEGIRAGLLCRASAATLH